MYSASLFFRLGPMDDYLLRDLPVSDAHALSLTGSVGYEAVNSFKKHSYWIELFLHPFFTLIQYKAFHILQSVTGLLISGSATLQFLDRIRYAGMDLNLYVAQNFATDVHGFLVHIGYALAAPSDQPFSDINLALNTITSVITHKIEAAWSLSHSGSTVIGSFHYYNAAGMWIVVKTTVFHPLLAILSFQNSRFHCSCWFHVQLRTFSLCYEFYHLRSHHIIISTGDFCGSSDLPNSIL